MIGTYTFRQDGKIVAKSNNIITTEGRKVILRSFVSSSGMGESLAVGAGDATATISDFKLQYQTSLTDIKTVGSDAVNHRVVFKGTLPQSLQTKVYEVGMYSNGIPDQLELVKFDNNQIAVWSGTPTFTSVNTRVGINSLVLNPAASATKTSSIAFPIGIDLSRFSATDQLTLNFFVTNNFTASLRIRIGLDSSNYYEFTITSPSAGYKSMTFSRSNMTMVGTPLWSNIKYIEASSTSTGGGTSAVHMDGLRIDDIDSVSRGVILVSRSVLPQPLVKYNTKTMDIEYAVGITI